MKNANWQMENEQQAMVANEPYPSNFFTTRAEFFDPNPMQLHTAVRMSAGREAFGT
jgi:hypothetical protein